MKSSEKRKLLSENLKRAKIALEVYDAMYQLYHFLTTEGKPIGALI